MANSGIAINDECKSTFELMKSKRVYQYILYGLSDDKKEIEVKKKAPEGTTYAQFKTDIFEAFEKKIGVYATIDLNKEMYYQEIPGAQRPEKEDKADKLGHIAFLTCFTDDMSVSTRMLHASSKEGLRKSLGLNFDIQCVDAADLDFKALATAAKCWNRLKGDD